MTTTPDSPHTALLVLDVMPVVIPAFGGSDQTIEAINRAIAAAREVGCPVIFGRVVFRDGYPEVASSNMLFMGLKQMLDFTESSPGTVFHPALDRRPTDLVSTRRRVSGFTASDLEVILRSLSIRRIAVTGVSTSGVVLSTVRAASDLDFEIDVLRDGCADADAEVHDVLMDRVLPMQANVTNVSDWAAVLARGTASPVD